jgi:hypothetical protein
MGGATYIHQLFGFCYFKFYNNIGMYGNILCNLSHSRTHSSNSYLQSRVQGAYQKHMNNKSSTYKKYPCNKK